VEVVQEACELVLRDCQLLASSAAADPATVAAVD
jgi:hypothetical protein